MSYDLALQLAALRHDLAMRLADETRDRQMIAEDAVEGIDQVIESMADRGPCECVRNTTTPGHPHELADEDLRQLRDAMAGRGPRDGDAQKDVSAVTEQTAMLPVSRPDLVQILTALEQRGDRTNADPQWRDLVERVDSAIEEWGPPTLREARRAEA